MRIGEFEVQGELARGAFGVVYRAYDPLLRRDVAIKLLLAGGKAGAYERRRFSREARALARLHHPNIVGVLGSGREGDHPYLVMKLVEGETLEARLDRDGPLPVSEAVALTVQLARAVDHAHQALILHRDIKPANVIVTPGGEPLLTDFGLAKDLAPSASGSISVQGRFMGTPGYWPPEQALGEIHQVGAPSDIYALGATLYACLTGAPPHSDASIGEALAALELPVPPPSSLRAGVGPELDRIVLGCLARQPFDRYASAADLADDLERWLRREAPRGPDALSRSGVRRVGLGSLDRQRLLPALLVSAVVLAGAAGVAALVLLTRPPRPQVAERASPTAAPTPDPAVQRAERGDDARRRLAALTARVQAGDPYDPALPRELMTAADQAPEPTRFELRRLARRYLLRRGRMLELLQVPPEGDPGPYRSESIYQRTVALQALGKKRESVDALRALADGPDDDPYTHLAAGLLDAGSNQLQRARRSLEEAERRGPELAEPLLLGMKLELMFHRPDAALNYGLRAEALAPDDSRTLTTLSRVHMIRGEREQSVRRLETAFRLAGPDPPTDLLIERVKAYYNAQRFDAALDAASDLTRRRPERGIDADVMAGVILYAQRRFSSAKRRWIAAHRRDPKRFRTAVRLHPPPNLKKLIRELVGQRGE